MTGDRRLRQVEDLDDVADAELAGAEQIENADPRRVGKALEQGVQIIDGGQVGSRAAHGRSVRIQEDGSNLDIRI